MYYITITPSKKRTIVLVGTFFLMLLVIHFSTPLLERQSLPVVGSTETMVDRVEVSSDMVVLTFNVTWGTDTFEQVLEELNRGGVRATFFIAGPWLEGHAEIAEQAQEDGHEIETLGYRQIDLTSVDAEVIRNELRETVDVHQAILDCDPEFFRPPGNYYDGKVTGVAMDLGMTTILSSVDAKDWTNPGPEEIAVRVTDEVKPGDIVQFHADDSSTQLGEALPLIIKDLHERGYQLVTISDVLKSQ